MAMSARASELTDRASSQPAAAAKLTLPSSHFRSFLQTMERLGYDAGSLREAAGVTPDLVDDPDARVSCEAYGAAVAAAQRARPIANLPLRLALDTAIGDYPLLDYVVVTSDTVGAGVAALARYCNLVSMGLGFDLHEEEDPVRVVMTGPTISVELTALLAVRHLRAEADGSLDVTALSFTHALDDAAEIEETLGVPVRGNAPWSGFAIARESWKLPLRRRDPVLRQLLVQQANDETSRAPAGDGFVLRVRRALERRVVGGDARVGSIARELAVSVRSLQRRLAADGVSYGDLLDSVRREAAERYLRDPRLAAAEVGYLLGYSEAAAFHRAFRRWTGTTPQAFRHAAR
jgi:AraC-like DNA-binding protein